MTNSSYIQFISNSIIENWSLPAFTDYNGKTYLYKDVAETTLKFHQVFEQNGIKKGDKIALIGKNTSSWATLFIAVTSYQAVIVPILSDFKPNDIHHIVNHSDSKILFVAENIWNMLNPEEISNVEAVFSADDFSLLHEKTTTNYAKNLSKIDENIKNNYDQSINKEKFNLEKEAPEDLAILSYTSGTTGFSKGVMLPYRSLIANIDFAQKNMPLLPNDSIVSFLPMAHTYGLLFEFVFPFTFGCHINFLGKTPSPNVIVEAFQKVKPRLILSVPLVIEKIYKNQIKPTISKPLMKIMLNTPILRLLIRKKIRDKVSNVFGGNFKEIVIGGAALNQEVERFFKKIKFQFTIGYGMTECGPLISYASWNTEKLYSCGRKVDSLELKIDSEDPQNTIGEIMVKGNPVMLGYYKNEEATIKVLDKEGWLRTGDMGTVDQNGNIFIKGRSKSVILSSSGQNIYPEEIEDKINSLPFVQECVVVQRDNKIVALVVPDTNLLKIHNIEMEKLNDIWETHKKHINETLPKYSNVSEIAVHTEEFDKTPKRSIKRYLYN